MSENIHAKSDKMFKIARRFIYPSLVYPAFLALWGLAAATSVFLTGHGIDLGLTVDRASAGFIPFTIPWLITGAIIAGLASDEKTLETKLAKYR